MDLGYTLERGDMPHDDVGVGIGDFDEGTEDIVDNKNDNVFINFENGRTTSFDSYDINNNSCETIDGDYKHQQASFTEYITETPSPSRKSMAVTDWVMMSHGIFASNEIDNQNTIYSLKHVPSNDRRSNAFLMGVNLQSMILGTSVLGFPFCVKIAGVWALFAIVVVGAASSVTSSILDDCQYQSSLSEPGKSKRIHVSFVQMSKICMGKLGAIIMKILVYLSLLRNVIVVILLTDLTHNILTECGVTGYDKKFLTVAWTLATIPLLFIKKVSYLAWVSFVGLKLYICALVSILVLCCLEYKSWDIEALSWDFDVEKFGIALGIIINSYSVHMNLPSLEGSLKNPRHYKAASNITFLFNNLVKISFALFGYLTYTGATKQEVIGNVMSYKPLPIVLQAAIIFFTYFTVPMQSFVAFELIDGSFRKYFKHLNKLCWLVLSRLLFMTFALFIAVLIPHFGIVVSLIGSVRGSMITLILPSAYYVMLRTHEMRLYKVVLCYGIMVFGIVSGLWGLYSALKALATGAHF